MYYASSHFTVFSFHSRYQGFLPNCLSVLTWVSKSIWQYSFVIWYTVWSEVKGRRGFFFSAQATPLRGLHWLQPGRPSSLQVVHSAHKYICGGSIWCCTSLFPDSSFKKSDSVLSLVCHWAFRFLPTHCFDLKLQVHEWRCGLSALPVPHCLCFICRSWTMSILKIHAREIFDSRGNPTVEVDLYTKKGTVF